MQAPQAVYRIGRSVIRSRSRGPSSKANTPRPGSLSPAAPQSRKRENEDGSPSRPPSPEVTEGPVRTIRFRDDSPRDQVQHERDTNREQERDVEPSPLTT